MHIVYRLFNEADELLYVGRTSSDLHERLTTRARETKWWPDVAYATLRFLPSRAAAKTAERAAIKTEDPRYNVSAKVHFGCNVPGYRHRPPDPMNPFS